MHIWRQVLSGRDGRLLWICWDSLWHQRHYSIGPYSHASEYSLLKAGPIRRYSWLVLVQGELWAFLRENFHHYALFSPLLLLYHDSSALNNPKYCISNALTHHTRKIRPSRKRHHQSSLPYTWHSRALAACNHFTISVRLIHAHMSTRTFLSSVPGPLTTHEVSSSYFATRTWYYCNRCCGGVASAPILETFRMINAGWQFWYDFLVIISPSDNWCSIWFHTFSFLFTRIR